MTAISQIASSFYAQIPNLNDLDAAEVDAIAANARGALVQVAGLLDTKVGDIYVFAGQDTANPPVPKPDQIGASGFATQIAAAVATLNSNGAAATAAATLAVATSNAAGTSPFSAYASQPASGLARPTVEVGEGQRLPVGLLASANADATSSPGSTTGSYMRDLMRPLATIGSLTSGQAGTAAFDGLVADTRTSLEGAISAMGTDTGVLGDRQTALQAMRATLDATVTALTGQISNAEDVDMTKALSQLTETQTQLQASYKLIATLKDLSLANFL
jgi:flagellin-like hook-associated protein FlgL